MAGVITANFIWNNAKRIKGTVGAILACGKTPTWLKKVKLKGLPMIP